MRKAKKVIIPWVTAYLALLPTAAVAAPPEHPVVKRACNLTVTKALVAAPTAVSDRSAAAVVRIRLQIKQLPAVSCPRGTLASCKAFGVVAVATGTTTFGPTQATPVVGQTYLPVNVAWHRISHSGVVADYVVTLTIPVGTIVSKSTFHITGVTVNSSPTSTVDVSANLPKGLASHNAFTITG